MASPDKFLVSDQYLLRVPQVIVELALSCEKVLRLAALRFFKSIYFLVLIITCACPHWKQ